MPKKTVAKRLCAKDKDGNVRKSLVTTENFRILKEELSKSDLEGGPGIQILQGKNVPNPGYRGLCKLYDSYLHKNTTGSRCKGADGTEGICCQAITEDGKRCTRRATKYLSIDLTESSLMPTIPAFIKKRVGAKTVAKLRLIGFANSCCFYCWQHAGMYAAEYATYVTTYSYYASHPEDLVSIFYDDVKVSKFLGIIPTGIEYGKMKPYTRIVREIMQTRKAASGALSREYWALFVLVFFYDKILEYIEPYLQSTEQAEKMAVAASKALVSAS